MYFLKFIYILLLLTLSFNVFSNDTNKNINIALNIEEIRNTEYITIKSNKGKIFSKESPMTLYYKDNDNFILDIKNISDQDIKINAIGFNYKTIIKNKNSKKINLNKLKGQEFIEIISNNNKNYIFLLKK